MRFKFKANKYGNKKTWINGEKFDSLGEAKRYQELKLLQAANLLKDLTRQVRVPLVVNKITVCRFIPDFTYKEDDVQVVEDFKGKRTKEYMIKKKLFLAMNPHIRYKESFMSRTGGIEVETLREPLEGE